MEKEKLTSNQGLTMKDFLGMDMAVVNKELLFFQMEAIIRDKYLNRCCQARDCIIMRSVESSIKEISETISLKGMELNNFQMEIFTKDISKMDTSKVKESSFGEMG